MDPDWGEIMIGRLSTAVALFQFLQGAPQDKWSTRSSDVRSRLCGCIPGFDLDSATLLRVRNLAAADFPD